MSWKAGMVPSTSWVRGGVQPGPLGLVYHTHIHTYGQLRITISPNLLVVGHAAQLQPQWEHANESSCAEATEWNEWLCHLSGNDISYCLADAIYFSRCDCSLMDTGCQLFLWWRPNHATWHILPSPPHTEQNSQLTERLHMLCISHSKVTVGCKEGWRDRHREEGREGWMDKGTGGQLTCHLSQRDKGKQR